MKNKVFYIILIICVILGGVVVFLISNHYSKNENSIEPITENSLEQITDSYLDIKIQSGEYHNKIWNNDNNQNVLDMECVPDKESAIQIANIIFGNKQKQGFFEDYKLQSVFYDVNDLVWVVSFWPSSENGILYAGSDFNIAISKNDAKILSIWCGE